jgi:ABC-2 type transport system permease protein
MTATTGTPTDRATNPSPHAGTTLARPSGLVHDIATVASRAVRGLWRDPEAFVPPLIIAAFFYAVNIGTLQVLAGGAVSGDYKAFQLPTAVIFAVTGISRAASLVVDIQGGYFDRLLLTPVRRVALLLGLLAADLVQTVGLTIPVLAVAYAIGVRFETGVLGILLFIVMAALWAIAFSGFIYAIALKTGNPTAVGQSFILFFPFAFLTTATVPEEVMTGWLAAVVPWNPLTYLLEGFRSLITEGWDASALAGAFAAIGGVGIVSMTICLAALRGRVTRG